MSTPFIQLTDPTSGQVYTVDVTQCVVTALSTTLSIYEFVDGPLKVQINYPDSATALAQKTAIDSVIASQSPSSPQLISVSPTTFVGASGATLTFSGQNFDPSFDIIFVQIVNPVQIVDNALPTFVSSSQVQVQCLAGVVPAGNYHLYYVDKNGNASVLPNAFLVG